MKYRVQFNAVFNNVNANTILNQVESIKDKIYNALSATSVLIIRKGKKLEVVDEYEIPTEYENIDFDESQDTHSGTPEGTGFKVDIDVSFAVEQDFLNFLNYIESIKSDADSDKIRYCGWFECRHEEALPLSKDGAYSYLDFDGEQIEH